MKGKGQETTVDLKQEATEEERQEEMTGDEAEVTEDSREEIG